MNDLEAPTMDQADIDPVAADLVRLRTTLANDISCAVVGLALAPLGFWAAASGVWSPSFMETAEHVRGGQLLVLANALMGPAPLAIGFGLFGFYLLCIGTGAAWRLMDRGPAVCADHNGFRFHPSICGFPVPWTDVRAIRVIKARPCRIRIDLSRRLWSPEIWLTGRSIRLSARSLGLSVREAMETVRALKALADGRPGGPAPTSAP